MSAAAGAARPSIRSAALRSLLRGGVLFLVLFAGVHTVLAATTGAGLDAGEVVALLLICVPQGYLTSARPPLTPPVVALGAAMLLAATALACAGLPFDRAPVGYSAWQFGAISIVLLTLLTRARYALTAALTAGVAAIAIGWSIATGHGPWPGVALVDRHVATIFVGGCFTVGYRRTMAAAREFHTLARRQRARESSARAQAAARRAAVEVVLEQAGPMLAAIAEDRPLSAADRRELVVIEGALRDRIRATRLLSGPLPDAVAAARRRGVDVLLLDESQPPEATGHGVVAGWLAERLDATRTGRFVGRLRDEAQGLHATAGSGDTSETATFPR